MGALLGAVVPAPTGGMAQPGADEQGEERDAQGVAVHRQGNTASAHRPWRPDHPLRRWISSCSGVPRSAETGRALLDSQAVNRTRIKSLICRNSLPGVAEGADEDSPELDLGLAGSTDPRRTHGGWSRSGRRRRHRKQQEGRQRQAVVPEKALHRGPPVIGSRPGVWLPWSEGGLPQRPPRYAGGMVRWGRWATSDRRSRRCFASSSARSCVRSRWPRAMRPPPRRSPGRHSSRPVAGGHGWRRRTTPRAGVRRVAVNRLAGGRRNHGRSAALLAAVRPRDTAELGPLDLDLLIAVRALPAPRRRCVCLHHIGGYSVEEVAAALGIAPGTVTSHLDDGPPRCDERWRGPTRPMTCSTVWTRLAPSIDEGAALGGARRRATRRLAVTGVSVAVVVALLAVAAHPELDAPRRPAERRRGSDDDRDPRRAQRVDHPGRDRADRHPSCRPGRGGPTGES